MPTDSDCVAEAYHEAAHAVVACLVDARFASANVQIAESDVSRVLAGMLERETDQTLQEMSTEALKHRVKVALAGEAAESIMKGRLELDGDPYR